MKVQLIHRQDLLDGRPISLLTHVKVMDETGRYLAFAKISPELLDYIRTIELEIPETRLNWKGKTSCSENMLPNS